MPAFIFLSPLIDYTNSLTIIHSILFRVICSPDLLLKEASLVIVSSHHQRLDLVFNRMPSTKIHWHCRDLPWLIFSQRSTYSSFVDSLFIYSFAFASNIPCFIERFSFVVRIKWSVPMLLRIVRYIRFTLFSSLIVLWS